MSSYKVSVFYFVEQQRYDVLRKSEPNSKKLSAAQKQAKYCEAVSEVMSPIALSVRPLHPAKVWEDISPQFLVTFWSLTMYDLFVPAGAYEREINKVKQLVASVGDSKDLVSQFQLIVCFFFEKIIFINVECIYCFSQAMEMLMTCGGGGIKPSIVLKK